MENRVREEKQEELCCDEAENKVEGDNCEMGDGSEVDEYRWMQMDTV